MLPSAGHGRHPRPGRARSGRGRSRRATCGGRRARARSSRPGVFFFHTWANVTAIRTEAGLVLVDTGNYTARAKTFAAVRAVDASPLHAAVYTHGHADHACGLPPFLEEAREKGRPRAADRRASQHRRALRPVPADRALERSHQLAPVLGQRHVAHGVRLSDRRLRHDVRARGGRHAARADPRARRDRRPHVALVARAAHPLHRRPLLLGRAQRRQPAEGPALRRRVGAGAARHGRVAPPSC